MPLIFVPTPLGNLGDITIRALETLRSAHLIVAEDTRVTRRLLAAHGISPQALATYNEYTSAPTVAEILDRALVDTVAAVSDAGMPGINDPGSALLRDARARGIRVEVLPGPSAVIGAAALSGFSLIGASFEGFVPRSAGPRNRVLAEVIARRLTSIWFETPHRIGATLDALAELAPELRVFLLREYTKRFEQQLLGRPAEVAADLARPPRGEMVLVLDAREIAHELPSAPTVDAEIDSLLRAGDAPVAVAKALAARGLGARRRLYARAVERGKVLFDDEGDA